MKVGHKSLSTAKHSVENGQKGDTYRTYVEMVVVGDNDGRSRAYWQAPKDTRAKQFCLPPSQSAAALHRLYLGYPPDSEPRWTSLSVDIRIIQILAMLGICETGKFGGDLTDIDPFPMPLEDSKRKVRGSESSNIRAACS